MVSTLVLDGLGIVRRYRGIGKRDWEEAGQRGRGKEEKRKRGKEEKTRVKSQELRLERIIIDCWISHAFIGK